MSDDEWVLIDAPLTPDPDAAEDGDRRCRSTGR